MGDLRVLPPVGWIIGLHKQNLTLETDNLTDLQTDSHTLDMQ